MRQWPSPSQFLVVLLLGGVLGALCDQIHVQFQVLAYPRPDVLQQAWWVAPNFGLAALVMLLTSRPFVTWACSLQPHEPSRLDLAIAWLWFLGAYVASGLLQDQPAVLLAGYVTAWLGRVLARPDRLPLLVHGAGLALIGSSYEALLSHLGTFHYLHPQMAGVPVWLPGLYLHGAPLAMAISRRLLPARSAAVTER